MKIPNLLGWTSALCLSALVAQAQEANEADKLGQQLKQMQEMFEKQQREMRENFERMFREQQAEIEALKKQVAAATNTVVIPTNAAAMQAQINDLGEKTDQIVEAQKKNRPNEFNPSIGFVSETIFSYRSQPSPVGQPGGWDVFQRTMELDLAASVDPFAKGYAVINGSVDAATGEASVGVEEAAIQTTSLPWNLELKAGRFFGEYGRLSYIHDHELPFVNRPLVLDEYIGGESQTDGLQLNWLLPTSHYFSLTAGAGDKFGDDPNYPGTYRSFNQLDFWSRFGTYFELTPNWQLEAGISGLWGPEAGSGTPAVTQPGGSTFTLQQRRVADLDLKLSYLPLRNNQFNGLVWGTEFLWADNGYLFNPDGTPGNPAAYHSTVSSFGLYSYVTYKWSRSWSAGFLFDWVQSPQNNGQDTYAFSPYLTFALSHWNQLRLQFTHTDYAGTSQPSDNAAYLQWVWIIGSHSHGWQAR